MESLPGGIPDLQRRVGSARCAFSVDSLEEFRPDRRTADLPSATKAPARLSSAIGLSKSFTGGRATTRRACLQHARTVVAATCALCNCWAAVLGPDHFRSVMVRRQARKK
jgi:hypothetical protein